MSRFGFRLCCCWRHRRRCFCCFGHFRADPDRSYIAHAARDVHIASVAHAAPHPAPTLPPPLLLLLRPCAGCSSRCGTAHLARVLQPPASPRPPTSPAPPSMLLPCRRRRCCRCCRAARAAHAAAAIMAAPALSTALTSPAAQPLTLPWPQFAPLPPLSLCPPSALRRCCSGSARHRCRPFRPPRLLHRRGIWISTHPEWLTAMNRDPVHEQGDSCYSARLACRSEGAQGTQPHLGWRALRTR